MIEKIDDETCCQLVRDLVAIESHSGNESAASRFLVEQFQRMGYDQSYVDAAGNAIGIRGSVQPDCQTIILLGHIDTVPGDIPVRVEDGILHGRGSVDAKGSLATFALAAAMTRIPDPVRLIVVGAVEEESATSKGARQIVRDFAADYCLIGEPSSSAAITLGYKGRILIEYEVQVDEGHTAGPEKNAAGLATDFWFQVLKEVEEFNQSRDKLFDQLLPSLRSINSGSDGLTSRAELKIGIRLPPDFDIDSFRQRLEQYAVPGTIRTFGYEAAHRSDRSNAVVRALATAIREAGLKPGYKLKTGTSDMNVVAPVWQCPIVAYGPGDSSLDHTPVEHLPLHEFLQAVRILTRAIEILAGRIAGSASTSGQ